MLVSYKDVSIITSLHSVRNKKSYLEYTLSFSFIFRTQYVYKHEWLISQMIPFSYKLFLYRFNSYVNKRFEELRRSVTIGNVSRKKRLPFDDYCLICGKHLFTFICLLNLGEECISCEHQCCSTCRKTLILQGDSWVERFYICKLCIEKR